MTPEREHELMEVRRILSGAYEEATSADRQEILDAARPQLAALRRAAGRSRPQSWTQWLGRRFQNPYVRLASLALTAALILFVVLSRQTTPMRSANVYTVQELTSGRSGNTLGSSALIFRGLE